MERLSVVDSLHDEAGVSGQRNHLDDSNRVRGVGKREPARYRAARQDHRNECYPSAHRLCGLSRNGVAKIRTGLNLKNKSPAQDSKKSLRMQCIMQYISSTCLIGG
jgi:hypothetical protein